MTQVTDKRVEVTPAMIDAYIREGRRLRAVAFRDAFRFGMADKLRAAAKAGAEKRAEPVKGARPAAA